MRLQRCSVAVAMIALSMMTEPARAELPVRHALSLDVALKMVDGCIAYAVKNNLALTIVVKDAGDDLLAFARMDGAGLGTIDAAMGKATASARFGAPTRVIADLAFDSKTKAPNALALVPGWVVLQGGLPIQTASGERLGAIAASGAAPAQDEACAQAGIDSVKADLQ